MRVMKRFGICVSAAAVLVAFTAGQGLSAERWAPIEGQAAARLPEPSRTKTISAARLECAEQRWSLEVALMPEVADSDGARRAQVAIGRNRFELEAEREGSTISIAVPSDMLPPLRAGIRMDVSASGGTIDHRARFSLIGSRRAIDAVAPRCSQRDMSAYTAIVPGELNPETVLARELLGGEIKAFRAATKSAPAVAAALANVSAERRLLFATLCGSSWYYGNSGCNMTIHAQEAGGDWQRVYETEGVAMHIDPNAQSEGWPNLVALTFDGEEIVWSWMNDRYEPPISEELRGG